MSHLYENNYEVKSMAMTLSNQLVTKQKPDSTCIGVISGFRALTSSLDLSWLFTSNITSSYTTGENNLKTSATEVTINRVEKKKHSVFAVYYC